jgi:hypothetical protein
VPLRHDPLDAVEQAGPPAAVVVAVLLPLEAGLHDRHERLAGTGLEGDHQVRVEARPIGHDEGRGVGEPARRVDGAEHVHLAVGGLARRSEAHARPAHPQVDGAGDDGARPVEEPLLVRRWIREGVEHLLG